MSQESEKVAQLSEAIHRTEQQLQKALRSNEASANDRAKLCERIVDLECELQRANNLIDTQSAHGPELFDQAIAMEQRAIAAERELGELRVLIAKTDPCEDLLAERDALQAKIDQLTRVDCDGVLAPRMYGDGCYALDRIVPGGFGGCACDLAIHLRDTQSALRATRAELAEQVKLTDQRSREKFAAEDELRQARAELERLRGDRECFGKLLAAERCAVDLSAKLAQAMNVVAAAKRWYSHGNDKELMASVKEYNASQPTPSEPKREGDYEHIPLGKRVRHRENGWEGVLESVQHGWDGKVRKDDGGHFYTHPHNLMIVESPEPNGEVGT